MKASPLTQWDFVRNIGRLTLLTRASYLSLLIVPLIAAFWPAVRGAINNYNEALTKAHIVASRLDRNLIETADALKQSLRGARNGELTGADEAIGRALQQIEDTTNLASGELSILKEQLTSSRVKNPKLPISWLFLYLAALSVFLGHLFYQLGCPPEIDRHSAGEFTKNRIDDYFQRPRPSLLKKYSLPILGETVRVVPTGDGFVPATIEDGNRARANAYFLNADPTLLDISGHSMLQNTKNSLDTKYHDSFDKQYSSEEPEAAFMKIGGTNLENDTLSDADVTELISYGCRVTYDEMLAEAPKRRIASFVFYSLSIAFILATLVFQIVTVFSAAFAG